MARQARIKSITGIYHVILKGLDGRNIFLDDSDRSIFMEKLNKAREAGGFQLYAYCLMDNHIHLLNKEGEGLGTSIKRITVGYVQLHNNKYGRTGHLFQNRFSSEAVEEEQYLMAVVRYIHRNPLKAGMIARLEDIHGVVMIKLSRHIKETRLHLILKSSKIIFRRRQILFVFWRKKIRMNVWKSIKKPNGVMHSLLICKTAGSFILKLSAFMV